MVTISDISVAVFANTGSERRAGENLENGGRSATITTVILDGASSLAVGRMTDGRFGRVTTNTTTWDSEVTIAIVVGITYDNGGVATTRAVS